VFSERYEKIDSVERLDICRLREVASSKFVSSVICGE